MNMLQPLRFTVLFWAFSGGCFLALPAGRSAEVGTGKVFSVVEIPFRGPWQAQTDTPARDIVFRVDFMHDDGTQFHVHGFHLGEDQFAVRFCPTKSGRWQIVKVESNNPLLNAQHVGDHVTAIDSTHHGFWIVDDAARTCVTSRRGMAAFPTSGSACATNTISRTQSGNRRIWPSTVRPFASTCLTPHRSACMHRSTQGTSKNKEANPLGPPNSTTCPLGTTIRLSSARSAPLDSRPA